MILPYPRPSIYTVSALVSYAFTMMFHVIAFCSNNWFYFELDGQEVSLGLWQGCRELKGSWECHSNIFEIAYNWHIGARVLMITLLVSLFLQEFALVGFGCVKQLEPHRKRLAAVIVGFAVAALICGAIVLHLMSEEPRKLPKGRLGWSYSMHVLSFIFVILTCAIVIVEVRFKDTVENKCKCLSKFSIITKDKKEDVVDAVTSSPRLDSYTNPVVYPEVTLNPEPCFDSVSATADNLSYRSGSYAYIPDNYSYSDITVSTDVVSYSQEPGRFRPDTLEWDV